MKSTKCAETNLVSSQDQKNFETLFSGILVDNVLKRENSNSASPNFSQVLSLTSVTFYSDGGSKHKLSYAFSILLPRQKANWTYFCSPVKFNEISLSRISIKVHKTSEQMIQPLVSTQVSGWESKSQVVSVKSSLSQSQQMFST